MASDELVDRFGVDAGELVAAYRRLVEENAKLRKALAGHLFDGESVSLREEIRSQLIIDFGRKCDLLSAEIVDLRRKLAKLDRGMPDLVKPPAKSRRKGRG